MKRDYNYQVVMRDLSQFSMIYFVPLADFHEGARDADHDVSDGYIQWIKERDNAFTLLNGDMLNCATKDSTPDLYEDLITADDAYKRLKARLYPIKEKILMITRGGHEEAIFRKTGTDYMSHLAHDLRPDGVPTTDYSQDIPYKPDGGMLGLRLSRTGNPVIFWGYATHGWGGARTIGAKVKKAEDLMGVADVDFYIISHDHTQNVHRANIFTPPRSSISCQRPMYMTINRKLFINTGGFIMYSGYVRRKGYVPQDLGTPRIRLEIKRDHYAYMKDLHASI